MGIIYVLEKFPNLTESFILNEIHYLEEHGIEIQIVAVTSGDFINLKSHYSTSKQVIYFNNVNSREKFLAHMYIIKSLRLKYFGVLVSLVLSSGGIITLLRNLKAFFISGYFLFKLKNDCSQLIHSQFINFPTTIAFYMSKLSNIPYSCSAHAYDIYNGKQQHIFRMVENSKFVVTCTLSNKQHLDHICGERNSPKIWHVYHGIDSGIWPFRSIDFGKYQGSQEIHLLTVARLVEKKGIQFLIESVKILHDKGIKVLCSIVGDGPLLKSLKILTEAANLEKFVTFYGALSYDKVRDIYIKADFFVLPCVITEAGDRDGLPNVLLESMAQGIPVISTNVSAISELVTNRVTGMLVPQKDANGIANAVLTLIDNPQLCRQLSLNARVTIENQFDIKSSGNRLKQIFLDNI